MPGPEVHATIYDDLRGGFSIAQPPAWLGWIIAGGGAWLALRIGRTWVSPLDPVLGIGLTTLAMGARDFAIEQRRRREVQGAFSQYISPVMVERLVENPELLRLGGERKELTIMFSDIRGLTTISEGMNDRPEELVQLINEIPTPISDIVIEHDGTIDK